MTKPEEEKVVDQGKRALVKQEPQVTFSAACNPFFFRIVSQASTNYVAGSVGGRTSSPHRSQSFFPTHKG